MLTCFAFGILKIETSLRRNCIPVDIARIVPIWVTGTCRVAENYLVACIVVPVKGCVPTVGNFIGPIYAVKYILTESGAIVISFLANIYLCIQIKAHKQRSGSSLSPFTLYKSLSSQWFLASKLIDTVLQFVFNKCKQLFGRYLIIGVFGLVIETYYKRAVAERIQQCQIEHRSESAALCLVIVEIRFCQAEFGRVKRFKILNHIVTLTYSLILTVPKIKDVGTIFGIPCVVVVPAPAATVIPPSVTGWCDQLIRREFLKNLTFFYRGKSMFKRACNSTFDITLRVVEIFSCYRAIECLVKIGACASHGQRQ